MPEHVQNEALLDRLLHGVTVEGPVLHRAVRLRFGRAENLQRLVLGRGGEGEVTRVGQQLLGFHQPVDLVLQRLVLLLRARGCQRARHRRRRPSALTRMRLVNDDRKPPPAMFIPDFIQDERKLLHRGDNDLLAFGDELPQVARVLGVPHRRAHLGELFDRVANLLIQNPPVRHHDD
jgi:hypothetical protein